MKRKIFVVNWDTRQVIDTIFEDENYTEYDYLSDCEANGVDVSSLYSDWYVDGHCIYFVYED